MKLKRDQRGMTLMGLIIVLGVLGFFAFCIMKIFPMYSEYRSVVEGMNAMKQDAGIRDAAPGQVWNALERRFIISYVENAKKEHFSVDKRTGQATIKYEVRTPLMYNLDVVGKFEYTVDLGK